MFTAENKEYSIIKFVISDTFSLEELIRLLGLISRVFEIKKPFSFFVHINLNTMPSPKELLSILKYQVSWMKSNQDNIINILQSSSIIINSSLVANFLTEIFKIKPTIKPNLITNDYDEGEKFVTDIMKKLLKKL